LQWEAENESRKARGGYWNPPAPHTVDAAQVDEQLEALRRKQSNAN